MNFRFVEVPVDDKICVVSAVERYVAWVILQPARWGRGVFAARSFLQGSLIGQYSGRVLGPAADSAVNEVVRQSNSTMLVIVDGYVVDGAQAPQPSAEQQAAFGRVVCEPTTWPGMYAHMINSAYDMEHQMLIEADVNCVVSDDGWVHATKDIKKGEELLWDYGQYYHDTML